MNFEGMIGLGVAGNFAGHLEQAGESRDFVDLKLDCSRTPKGLFPFYIPGSKRQLGIFPVSSTTIDLPVTGENVQVEPEVALVCDLIYNEDKSIKEVIPRYFGAFNDGSIRREGAKKISEKKNWGPTSKGLSQNLIAINSFDKGGILDGYRLGCSLKRGGVSYPYGVDSACRDYSFFHHELLEWMTRQLNEQIDEGPLECLSQIIKEASYPSQALIAIGATRYSAFGEKTYLESGDEVTICVYPKELKEKSLNDMAEEKKASTLVLRVE